MKAYLDNICCMFGPSKKILTDNGTEFKKKTLDGSIQQNQNRTQNLTHIFTPMQQKDKQLPQVPESYYWETAPKRTQMGKCNMQGNISLQLISHTIFQRSTILPHILSTSRSETHATRLRITQIPR